MFLPANTFARADGVGCTAKPQNRRRPLGVISGGNRRVRIKSASPQSSDISDARPHFVFVPISDITLPSLDHLVCGQLKSAGREDRKAWQAHARARVRLDFSTSASACWAPVTGSL